MNQMNQRIISGYDCDDINEKLNFLRDDYLVTITHLSTSSAPRDGRSGIAITVVVDLYKPIESKGK